MSSERVAIRVAIVTAAGRGMGAAIARELAADGYALALLSSSGAAEKLAEELGGIGLTGSVTEPAVLERLVETTMERHGRIDAVVNNTGHVPKGDLLDHDDAAWHASLDMTLLNVVRMARLVTPVMRAQGGGAIVNVSTFSAFEPSLDYPVSSTLRAGLGSFTKLYADRYAADNIRMNSILPASSTVSRTATTSPRRCPCAESARWRRSRRPRRFSSATVRATSRARTFGSTAG